MPPKVGAHSVIESEELLCLMKQIVLNNKKKLCDRLLFEPAKQRGLRLQACAQTVGMTLLRQGGGAMRIAGKTGKRGRDVST